MNKKEIRMEIGILMDNNCVKCEKNAQMKHEKMSEKTRQTFCLEQCPVGQKVNQLGDLLLDKDWSDEELFYLLNHLGTRQIKYIARSMGKTIDEVQRKVKLYKNNLIKIV